MSEQLFKVGERYKTREGHDAIIYVYCPEQEYCYLGATKNSDGSWLAREWRAKGDGAYSSFYGRDGLDLMLPEKPKKKLYAYISKIHDDTPTWSIEFSSTEDAGTSWLNGWPNYIRAPQFDCYVEEGE